MLLTPNWPIAEQPKGKPGEVFPADYLAIPCVCDWDGDGDSDLVDHSSARITCYVERSFLQHGYRPASIIIAERRND